ncbi:TPA: hypothetical protein LA742_001076 [Clostridium botulinum]|nr:hypothetical protein [Clostridium botulinum]
MDINKIDYDREYNIMELFNFTDKTEFIDDMCLKVRINSNCLEVLSNKEQKWKECKLTKNWLDTKFKIVKKDKKVSFKEAIQAYGKEIYCIWKDDNNEKHVSNYKIRNNWEEILDFHNEYLSPEEILNGEWYIKED